MPRRQSSLNSPRRKAPVVVTLDRRIDAAPTTLFAANIKSSRPSATPNGLLEAFSGVSSTTRTLGAIMKPASFYLPDRA